MHAAAGSSVVTEATAVQAERATAFWTELLAFATFSLGLGTSAAIIVPLIIARRANVTAENAALRQLSLMLAFLGKRTGILADAYTSNANIVSAGMDLILSRILSEDMAKSLPPTTLTLACGIAVLQAHQLFSKAALAQEELNQRDLISVQRDAIKITLLLNSAHGMVQEELTRRKARPVTTQNLSTGSGKDFMDALNSLAHPTESENDLDRY
jgi:hypothetical protein